MRLGRGVLSRGSLLLSRKSLQERSFVYIRLDPRGGYVIVLLLL